MTTVSQTAGVGAAALNATASQNAGLKTGLDYNAFLQLLIAQLKNQDPLSPMDPTEQMSQLASFSNVEQTIKLNSKLDAIMTVSSLTQADSMIGRTLTSPDGATSGVVKAVQVRDTAVIAVLENGKELALGSGMKIE